ncbi:Diaminopimelate epimerase-like protein [Sistotremastrum niveocremeum HHB9708]|uniref:Diaminopimelate epimerase-like protein n=1 Tax=Sistotremastrum niveocremeum HHB9708 TaxID=1314777 RepID=A0A164SH93_9AGAM|nr:Diaminopimelate epimerase-like protein [Sistotremastrum niveocremeum HHB9708]
MPAPNTAPYVVLDAFTQRPFKGNPAWIVLFPSSADVPSDETLHHIACEFGQDTAFVTLHPHANADLETATFGLRWFTPAVELKLCGHLTLATSSYLFQSGIVVKEVKQLRYETRAGILTAEKLADGKIELEFPGSGAAPVTHSVDIIIKAVKECLGHDVKVLSVNEGARDEFKRFALVEIDPSVDLGSIKAKPEVFAQFKQYELFIITKKSSVPSVDFESRVFGPNIGVDEDPVTGSAHCLLGPYWSDKLKVGSKPLNARQVSPRGGDLVVVWNKPKGTCLLRGNACPVAEGKISF